MKNFTCLLLISGMWLNFFASFVSAQSQTAKILPQTEAKGLQFRVTESKTTPTKNQTTKRAETSNLSESETNDILNRLPKMPLETIENTTFKMRSDSLKPPKAGNIIPLKFPADEPQTTPNTRKNTSLESVTQPLEIERFSPEGSVDLVPELSITFSQPMIAVATQATASENVPVKLSPEVKGKWRWLGTNTLIFDAETRFQMATKFTATIPKGTKSAIGGTLEKDFTWTFSTSSPKIETFSPTAKDREVVPQNLSMFAKFNQEIDGEAILRKIRVIANDKVLKVKLSTNEIITQMGDEYQFDKAKPKHWLAFRTTDLLPVNTDIKVIFEKGLPSAEGSTISETEQIFTFKTLETFKLSETLCGYVRANERQCQPSDNFTIRYNRSLFPTKLDASLLKIEPPIENAEIQNNGSEIYIKGKKQPNTTYKITLSGEAIDYHKQKIGEDISVTFNVGVDQPKFFAQGGNFVTLDPNAKPTFSVYTKNHPSFKVKLYSVTPEDYLNYREVLQRFYNSSPRVAKVDFGKLIFDETVEIKSEIDILTETRIDLSKAVPNKFGHAIVVAEPILNLRDNMYEYYNQPIVAWIQSTNIGIDAFIDYEKMSAFATDLNTAKPISNAEISLHYGNQRFSNSITNQNGIANFNLLENAPGRGFLLVKNSNDSAILPENNDYYAIRSDWEKKGPYEYTRWSVFDDRKMYRPNEEVAIKGYLRQVTGGKFADIAAIGNTLKKVKYILRDQRNNEIAKGTAELNTFGAFDFKLKLPENINLGYQRLSFWRNDTDTGNYPEFEHTFQVQEFRRPEFEVTIKSETAEPFFVGTTAEISAEAKYYTDGFLPDSPINWSFAAFLTNYSPPNHNDFTFGTFIPWWRHYSEDSTGNGYRGNVFQLDGMSETGEEMKTDANGKHQMKLDFISANPARPYTLRATANVADVNRQNIADTKTFLVHPSDFYVGLRTVKTFVRREEPLKVEAIATDIDGKIAPNAPIKIVAVLKDWQSFGSNWREVIIDTQTCEFTSTEVVGSCEFKAKQGGVFTITATILDTKERPNTSEITVWVAGANTPPKREVEKETVELIPDKKEYQPNDTAEILVTSPIFPAECVMTLERNGIVKTERLTMNEASTVLQIPIEERYLPNITVKVDAIGIAPRTNDKGEIDKNLPTRPAFASGEINLNVSTASRKLSVAVEPIAKIVKPGERTKINVEVKDSLGNGVANSEVALIAVDESVLSLTDYKIPNPLDTFYQKIAANVAHYHSREKVILANPDDITTTDSILAKQLESLPMNGRRAMELNMSLDGSGADNASDKSRKMKSESNAAYKNWIDKDVDYIISPEEKSEISIRRNFDALAIFSPSVITDANGKATVDVKLPDNLTRYRITAVAVTKSKQFGLGESTITAKQALQVRPSAPRFLNFGDKFELPVVLQNQTENALTVNVAVRANNANFTKRNGKKVVVPANDRVEIQFPVAANLAGTARFQIGATSGNLADAAEIELPVYTPATTETFATYGTTDANGVIVQPINTPKDVWSEFGGLEVSTSSTQLQELTDAFTYLYDYPFNCSEQVSSRMLSVAALRDVLTAFNAKGLPTKDAIERQMRFDIERLQSLQHYDGGFSFWRNDDDSLPYLSVHVAHAIARAKAKDYKISAEMIAKSKDYLKNIEAKLPKEYSEESRWAISAYALFVRDLLGDKDAAKAKKLLNDVGLNKLSLESIGWILSVLADDKNSATEVELIKRNLLNRVTETAGAAHFVSKYKDGEYVLLSSERRADGVILEALLRDEETKRRRDEATNPQSDELIPKIVRGLLSGRTKGRWGNTQENAFILLALDKYFHVYEKVTPNFVAKVWLGDAFAGEQKFAGRSADTNSISVPMNYLQSQKSTQNLAIDKQGEGRLYYRIGMNYAPKSLKVAAADYGFAVTRTYEAIDNADDVKQNSDGSWTIKSGSRVRVNVQMVAPTRRYHVALVDNLPAGIEIINTNLATSGDNYAYQTDEIRRRSYWFNHQNLRDNRAEAFTTLLSEGVWDYSYLARATTPGNFVVPPAKAEEMYAPETFGRSKTDFVKVE